MIDTTDLTPAELREELLRRYGGDVDQPVLTIVSFGFARGISRTADLVFDMRFLANPHWVDELAAADRARPGGPRLLSPRTRPGTRRWTRSRPLLTGLIPRYWAAGKSYLTVAFGCTGGRHRSVAAAVEMAERLRGAGFSPNVRHRDLASPPSDTIEERPAEHGAGTRASDEAGE